MADRKIENGSKTLLLLGDSRKVANINAAIWDGYEAARYM